MCVGAEENPAFLCDPNGLSAQGQNQNVIRQVEAVQRASSLSNFVIGSKNSNDQKNIVSEPFSSLGHYNPKGALDFHQHHYT